MPRLSAMKAKVKTATVQYDGEDVPFGYKPGELTLDLMDDIQEQAARGDKDTVGAMLEPILEWWDVLDDNDQRLPTDRATIRTMPMAFLTLLMQTMVGDLTNPPA